MFYLNRIKNYILFLYNKHTGKLEGNHGFQDTSHLKIIKDGDYFGWFTKTKKRVINKSKNFLKFRPKGEQQNEGWEKMWCVSESGDNVIEEDINCIMTLQDEESKDIVKVFDYFGLIKDGECKLCTNYPAIGSGTTRNGNSQKNFGNFIRKYGFLPANTVPVGKNWADNYYRGDTVINGNRMDKKYLDQGKKILEYIDIQYEWVHPSQFDEMRKYGSIQVSVRAPSPLKDGIYQKTNLPRNHAVTDDNTALKHEDILDSYDPFGKKFAKDYKFGYGMLFTIRLKKPLTGFNVDEIEKLKNRGWKYILLVKDTGKYKKGAYELLDNKLVSANIDTVVDEWVEEKANKGELEGINSDDFRKLVNL